MLYPQLNPFRQITSLDGFWDLRFDPDKEGEARGWARGFEGGQPVAVPASWNEQFVETRDYLGTGWYQTRFDLPWGWESRRVRLRFASVNYLAEAWLNGIRLGQHEGGHLPFEFEVTPHLRREQNLLVVRVNGELAIDRVPPGNIPPDPHDTFNDLQFPDASFDFFPYCGIQRPVLLYAVPEGGLEDLTAVTELGPAGASLRVQVQTAGPVAGKLRFTLQGHGLEQHCEAEVVGASAEVVISAREATLWSPASPTLYNLTVELARAGATCDRYTLAVGLRTVAVDGDNLLLNGQPIKLQGFGRHEDFPVVGRGLMPAVIVKDYALMRWIGANSFRTSHYPYSEQMMDLADQLGFLVIAETPAVGLFFKEEGLERRLSLCQQYTRELIARDKNHPSVIMWSIANEPHSKRPPAREFFRQVTAVAREMDSTRPVTMASMPGVDEEALDFCDVLGLNRYSGWYSQGGQLDKGFAVLEAELEAAHRRWNKPIILTEFGADALPGWHAEPPEMFSEEYQADMLEGYIKILDASPYVIGHHVWNMCDFKTPQAVIRVGSMNLKGVFTRDRRPKLAAHRLRALWGGDKH